MKQKRAKAYRRLMSYYHINFKFREPFQVLVDEEIILECMRTKFDLVAGLKRTLQGEVKPSK
jgi:U3 small nucleolar RNA-associated protein 23